MIDINTLPDFGDTLDELTDEIMETYFSHVELDEEFECWKTNPFLWLLYCVAADRELSFPPKDQSPSEYDCVMYFLKGFAFGRLIKIMTEKEGSNVQ
jgi:hypothetical protein